MKTLTIYTSSEKKMSYRFDFSLLTIFTLTTVLFEVCRYACFWRMGFTLYQCNIASDMLANAFILYLLCAVVLLVAQIRRAIRLGIILGWRRFCVQLSFVFLAITLTAVVMSFGAAIHIPVTKGLVATLEKKADISAIKVWLESSAGSEYISKYGELPLCELIVNQNEKIVSPDNIRSLCPDINNVIEQANFEEIRKWLNKADFSREKNFEKLEEQRWPEAIRELSPGSVRLLVLDEMQSEVWLSWGGGMDESKWPEAIRCLNPMRVQVGLTNEGRPYARLLWGGRDIGLFGVVVGVNPDEIKYDDSSGYEYRIKFHSEAFIWHRRL